MIEIQRPEQFTRAAERLLTERIHVRRFEQNFYRANNLTKGHGHAYFVRIERMNGKTFGTCTCEAGTPTFQSKNRNRVPMVCKHLAAVVIYLRGIREMRRHVNA